MSQTENPLSNDRLRTAFGREIRTSSNPVLTWFGPGSDGVGDSPLYTPRRPKPAWGGFGAYFRGAAAAAIGEGLAHIEAPTAPPVVVLPRRGTEPTRLISIDIGRTGALALFVRSDLVELADMPVLADGPACRATVNGPLLAALIRRWAPTEAVCEHVSARPGEAPSGAFAFGRSRGVIEGVLADQGVPVRFVTPAWWKRRVSIPAGRDHKDVARSVAIARWPDRAELFARAKDHDRAEAALIGLAYLQDTQR